MLFCGKNQLSGLKSRLSSGSMLGLLMIAWTICRASGPSRAVVFRPACGTLVGLGPTICEGLGEEYEEREGTDDAVEPLDRC